MYLVCMLQLFLPLILISAGRKLVYNNFIISYHLFGPVLSESVPISSQSKENRMKCLSYDGLDDAGSHEKEALHHDLLSPMREEKSLLAIKAVSTNRCMGGRWKKIFVNRARE